jgi:acetolactate synthase I/II/III large subunit
MEAWRSSARQRTESRESPINIGRLIGELNKTMPADGIVVADGGFAAHWGGLLFDTKAAGRHFLPDRGFASAWPAFPSLSGQLFADGQRTSSVPCSNQSPSQSF